MAKFVTCMSFDTQWKQRWKPHFFRITYQTTRGFHLYSQWTSKIFSFQVPHPYGILKVLQTQIEKMYDKKFIKFSIQMISRIPKPSIFFYLRQLSASARLSDDCFMLWNPLCCVKHPYWCFIWLGIKGKRKCVARIKKEPSLCSVLL